jgi:NCS1 family nucleobase:cation symporter-1
MLDDADISWAVSLVVTAVVYYALQRNAKVAPSEMILEATA